MYFKVENKNEHIQIIHGKSLGFEPHIHSHIEVVLLREGMAKGVADDKEGIIDKGDLFISMPNQIHHYYNLTSPQQCEIAIISPDFCPEFSKIFKNYIPENPIYKGAINNKSIEQAMSNLVRIRKIENEFDENEARGNVLILLSELFRNMHLVKKPTDDYVLVKNIINYCYENYTADISLQSVAKTMHVNKYYVSHLFSKRMKVGFSSYINSMRIRAACDMLKHGNKTVTEVAYAVGYNSIRTFDRQFMQIKGMTPKEYIKRAFEKKQNIKQDA